MHSYLRAIGFSKIKKDSDLMPLLQTTIENPDFRTCYGEVEGENIVELKKEYGSRFGLAICGSLLDNENFHMEYYYPYFRGTNVSTEEKLEVEKHSDKNAYSAICEDVRLGVTLIYYVQNICDYKRKETKDNKYIQCPSIISALSIDGRIILPVNAKQTHRAEKIERLQNRARLLRAAKEGDEEAIETLTVQDLDTYTMLSNRVFKEDMMSIIDTSIMPSGIDSDTYTIVAEILDCISVKNEATDEDIYLLTVIAKDIIFDVCINRQDLVGIPTPGMRFRGNIWMQGQIQVN